MLYTEYWLLATHDRHMQGIFGFGVLCFRHFLFFWQTGMEVLR